MNLGFGRGVLLRARGGFSGGKFFMKKILFPGLFAFTSAGGFTTIVVGNHANLDNGIRALPRFSGAEEEQEEGVGR